MLSDVEARIRALETEDKRLASLLRQVADQIRQARSSTLAASGMGMAGGDEDAGRFVQITGPISGGVYPGVIVERTSGGSWVSTGEVVEVLAL